MSKTVQWKRGNANVSSTYTGPEGELTVNTTNWTLNIHDGVTQGGHPASFSLGNLDVSDQTIFGTVSNANIVIDPDGTGIVVLNNGVTTSGNVTASYFVGNGSLLSGITTNYSNANVAAYLPSYTGNISAGNLLITDAFLITANSANNFSTMATVANNDARISATNGALNSTIYLWANNGRMSFNTVSNAFDFNFNGQLSATDFTASKSSTTGYSFYTPGEGLAGFTHVNGPPSYIRIVHDDIEYTKFYANYTTQTIGNLVISSNANVFGSFPTAFVQVYANVNSYSQIVHQNLNSGNLSSSDFVGTADNGTDATHYVDLGIASSTYNFPGFEVIKPNDVYLLAVGNNVTGPGSVSRGNLVIGSTTGNINFFVGAPQDANVITQINSTGLVPGANVTYSLGSATRQWKDLWLSNSTMYLGGFPITVSNTGVLSVNGSPVTSNASSYGNANVASYLPTYSGNIGSQSINFTSGKSFKVTSVPSSSIGSLGNKSGDIAFDNSYVYFCNADFSDANSFTIQGGDTGTSGFLLTNIVEGQFPSYITTDWYVDMSLVGQGNVGISSIEGYNGNVRLGLDASRSIGLGLTYILRTDTSSPIWSSIPLSTFQTSAYGNANVTAFLPTYSGNVGNGSGYFFGNGSQLTGVTASANTGNVTFNDQAVVGTGNPEGGGGLYLAPGTESVGNLQYIRVRGGDVATHIHLDTGNNAYFDQYFGDDSKYVKLEAGATGNIMIGTNAINWNFDASGDLTVPGNLVINGLTNVFGSNVALLQSNPDLPLLSVSSGSNGGVSSLWVEDIGNTGTSNIAAVYANPTPGSGIVRIAVGQNGSPGPNLWDFDAAGNLSAPGNVSAVGNVTGGNIITAGNITGNTGGFAIGYRDIPQVVFTSNATLALTDAGKHYFSSNSANVITVPNNTTVSFSIGTAISIIQQGTANLTVTPGSGVTMYLAGNSTSSSRTVGNYGMATLMKVGTDTWFINGTGVN